jgi:hypothetical protein
MLQFDRASFDFAQDEGDRIGHQPTEGATLEFFLVLSGAEGVVEGRTIVLQ